MKRKAVLFLSAVMAASSLPMTAYAANFKDINEVPWAATVINNVADKGLLSGYEDGTFRGKNNVTYCEAMLMVYNALVKNGAADPIDAVDAYSYMSVLNTYKVPSWCQMAVAYGLHHNIIDMQMVASKFAGGTQKATREDVALLFGNALAVRYNMDGTTPDALSFKDYWRISANNVIQVDLLKRLGILSGDENGYFNPKNNITRAEMAVMLSNTCDVLEEGVFNTGVIKTLTQNDGNYYYIEIEFDNGEVDGYHATPDHVKVYAGNTNQEMALSRISKGDKIKIVENGGALSAIYVLDAVPAQAKYDMTGFIEKMEDSEVTFDNENTGEREKLSIDKSCICYLEGKQVSRKELEKAIKDNYSKHAYAGVMTETELEKQGSSRVEVTSVVELHVTFTDELTTAGKVVNFTESGVRFQPSGTSGEQEYKFAASCEFFIGDTEVDIDEAVELADSGTVYVQVTVNQKEQATKVTLSEDSFDTSASSDKLEGKIMKLLNFTTSRMKVEVGGEEYTYKFGSENPLKNISFYKWDDKAEEWDELKNEDKAEEEYDKLCEKYDDKVYCQLDFNSGGKITSIEMSGKKGAWSADDDQTERKGTVASLENGKLKFKSISTTYEMLNKYNVDYNDNGDDDDRYVTGDNPNGSGKVRNPLSVTSAVTSSLKVFEKMANDDSLELYAEILADSDNKVQKVDARLTSAVGYLVEYDDDDNEITIETEDGNEFKLQATGSPSLVDEDEDTNFTIEKIMSTTSYIGSKLELGFNGSGKVNEIEVLESSYSDGLTRIKGVATSADDGLKVEGTKGTFAWQTRSYIRIDHMSSPSTDLEKLKDLIEDDSVEVYVEAVLDDRDRVESIDVWVRSAEGTLKEYDMDDDMIRLTTDEGNTFSFYAKNSMDCDVDGITDLEKLESRGAGKSVKLTFDDNGSVKKIVG